MVQTGKLAVISILAVLGLGALGGGFYVGNTYIPDALDEGIKDSLVVDENYATDDPKGYADWLTNNDDGDPPKYKRYYLWNLTNPDEYLTGSTPIYEELGPYAYRQFDVKVNVELTSTTKKYQTYTFYEFDAAESTGSETDRIVNINPAYLGVIAGAGSEAALVTGFVGPTISGILDGLLGDFTDGTVATGISTAIATIMASLSGDFVDNVKVQGASIAFNTTLEGLEGEFPETVLTQAVALGLLDIQAGMTESFHTAVNATTAATVMWGNWATAQGLNGTDIANEDFFNSTSFFSIYNGFVAGVPPIQGLGEFTTANLGYTNASVTKLLWDGPDGIPQITGWFGDLAGGSGVLGFLQLYENATLEVGGMTKTILGSLYNVTENQLDAAANYLLNYLILDNALIEATYQGGNDGQTTLEAAQALFLDQWANATSLPGGADINSDGITPDGFEVGLLVDSDISNVTAAALFDPTNPLSLTNSTQGIFAWVGAANGNVTLNATLYGFYTGQINQTQFNMLYAWLNTFRDFTIQTGLIAEFAPLGVTQLKELGYVHWGSDLVTSGLSLFDLDPSLGAYPEPWAWASNVASTTWTLNMSNSENLLTGAYNFTDAVSLGTFLQLGQLAAAGDGVSLATINTLFETELDTGNVTLLLGFIDYIMNTLVLNELPVSSYADLAAFQWGNSTVTEGASVNEINPVGFWPELWAYVNRELSGSITLNLATSLALTTGLQTPEGVGAFLVYGASAAGGNATALAIINGALSTTITGAEAGLITSYLGYLLDTLVLPVFGVTTTDDIGYAHWGSSIITGGLSLTILAPDLGLPDVPEFWAWASAEGTPKNLTLTQSKALLTGDNSLLNSTTVGMMLLAAAGLAGNDAATIGLFDALLGASFTAAEYGMLLGYIAYMMETYVAGWVLAPIFAAGGGLIATKTITEWLWEYDDPLLAFLKENGQVDDSSWSFFPPDSGPTDPNLSPASTFMTGADDINNVMQYVLWQGIPALPDRDDDPVNGVWDHVEPVQGTDATQFHPDVTNTEVLRAWVSELARTVDITYLEDTETEGIDLLRFVLSVDTLAVNSAFDQEVKGVANMTYSQGVPLFISKPHFLDAEAAAGTVTGLVPVRADHETFIDVEPTTGAVMNAAKRLQISFQISAGNYLTLGVADTHFMPVIWVEEGGAITPELAEDFKNAIYGAQQIEEVAPIAGAAIGAVLLLTSMFIGIRARKP